MTTIALPALHPQQQDIAEDPARFKVLAAGRRWGKTRLGVILCFRTALHGGRAWWVAPTYKICQEGWTYLSALASQIPGARVKEGEMEAHFPGGGYVQIRTGHDPQALRGAGLDGVVLDEAAYLPEEAWTQALRPSLADHKGWALFISTPAAQNWFHRLYEYARGGADGWSAWQVDSLTNPFLDPAEIEDARRVLDPADFAREFQASFRSVANAIYDMLDPSKHVVPMPQKVLWNDGAIGVDYGRVHLSAAVVVQRSSSNLYWVRECWTTNTGSEEAIASAVAEQRQQYRPIWRLRTDPVQEVLAQRLGGKVASQAPNSRKARIETVRRLLAQGALRFDANGKGIKELIDEMLSYHWQKMETDYRAEMEPVRKYDDRVAALEYAIEALEVPTADLAAVRAMRGMVIR